MNLTVLQDGSEQIHYNDPRIPLYARRGNLKSFSGMAALCHWHDDVELLLPMQGHLCYSVNGTTVEISHGEAIFVNSRQMHFGYSADGTDCQYICVTFRPQQLWGSGEIGRRFVLPILSAAQLPYLLLRDEALTEKIRQVDALYQQQPIGYELLASSALLALWQGLYVLTRQKMALLPPGDEASLQAVRRMLDFVRTHYAEQITLAAIAAAGGVCRTQCCRMFRQYLNRTPNDYLNSFRLEKSMELLRATDLPVTEIAAACGYSGSSYFAECFRRAKGCTPMQYRLRKC